MPKRSNENTTENPSRKNKDYIKGISKVSKDSFEHPQQSYRARLGKAVEKVISAGYQLSKEGFDYLNENAAIRDPVDLVENAIRQLMDLQTKPLFIERSHLDRL